MTDPWAAASAKQENTSNTSTVPMTDAAASVPSGPVQNMANPFATQRQAAAEAPGGGGQWDPRIPFGALSGRMIVMVPKSYTDKAPVPKEFNPKEGEVREEYTVDIVVLDGGPLTYSEKFRPSKDAELEEREVSVTEFPYTRRGQRISQGQLVRALKGADKSGAFLYGVMTMVPQLRDSGLYPTPEALAEARKKWISELQSGKTVAEPRYTWGLDERPHVLTDERVNLALAWWETEKRNRLASPEPTH
jgi:hypothetical protein